MIICSKLSSYFTFLSYAISSPKFNKFINYIWPIERYELPKFLSITLLMFCILFIQNLIRALKDSIINTMIGTESIAFLKFWGVMPLAFLVTIIYIKLINKIKSENLFYLIILIFLVFFSLFAFYIFPNHNVLHLNSKDAQILVQIYPNFKWFIILLSNWSFSLFYIMAELWPSVVFALLVWQFINNITSVEESKRFYPLLGLLSQTGLIFSGKFLTKIGHLNEIIFIQIVLTLVLVLGITALLSFWIINHKILHENQIEQLQFSIKKHSMTILESFKMILLSKYIMLIAILLVCYGMTINLVEGPWKASVAKIYKTTPEFAAFIGQYLSYTGVCTILFTILCSNLIRRLGWFTTAMITPIITFVTGMLFFLVNNFEGFAALATLIVANFILTDPALIAITIGVIQNVLSKSSKYILFDSTKEMSYVPLDIELKTKGKAAIEVVGIKLGKSVSALIQSLIFIILPHATYQSVSICLMIIFSIICVVWMWAVRELSQEYNNLINK